MGCFACEASTEEKGFVMETGHWRWYLTFEQSYLGRSMILLKRHAGSIPELTTEEWLELQKVMEVVENSLKRAFGAEVFNWSCLLNDAYKNDPPNPHVHWHVRPRYRNKVEFAGMTFDDPDFGHHYSRDRRDKVGMEALGKIAGEIRRNLHK